MISLTCLYIMLIVFFFFKQKTAYEMRISDWSSDVCSSDLLIAEQARHLVGVEVIAVAVAGAADISRPIIGCIAYRERFGDACGADARVGPDRNKLGRAHVCTPVTNEHLVCRLQLEKKKIHMRLVNFHVDKMNITQTSNAITTSIT